MVEQIAGCALPIDETALVEVTVDRFEDRDAAGSLMNCNEVQGRELARLGELRHDLHRPRLEQTG